MTGNPVLDNLISRLGELGVMAVFAYLLLRAFLKTTERLTKALETHLKGDIENLVVIRESIKQQLESAKIHETHAEIRHEKLVGMLKE